MKTILIDHGSAVPVYRQIADALRGLVARDEVRAGDTLPSVRRLGHQLGVNLNTVAKAYRLLADEGLVVLKQGALARFAEGAPAEGAVSLEEPSARVVRGVIDRWVLAGADRTQVETLLQTIVDDYFKGVPQ